MSNYYEAAKMDFAVSSKLIQKRQFFLPEQLTGIYRCVSNEQDNNFNLAYEQEMQCRKMPLRFMMKVITKPLP